MSKIFGSKSIRSLSFLYIFLSSQKTFPLDMKRVLHFSSDVCWRWDLPRDVMQTFFEPQQKKNEREMRTLSKSHKKGAVIFIMMIYDNFRLDLSQECVKCYNCVRECIYQYFSASSHVKICEVVSSLCVKL